MAKGTLNGILKGKLGNTVFYKITNSNDKEKQGTRAYVASVANPKTAPQANQRMRMKPAINFYRGLADLLDHSWEGVKYGSLSRQKFMSMALSPTVTGIPYVDKGETRFIPGEYPVSVGSVGASIVPVNFAGHASFNINMGMDASFDDAPSNMTYGAFSELVLDANAALRDGDELTFIAVVENDGLFLPIHTYIVLDTASTLPWLQVLAASKLEFVYGSSTMTSVTLLKTASWDSENGLDSTDFAGTCVAAAVIVSRHPSRTSTTWLRSTSTMVVADTFRARWMSADRYAAALLTYQNSATELTSDWLLNQAGSASGNAGSGEGGGLIQNFTLENREVTGVGEQASSNMAYYNDGTKEGFLCNSFIPTYNVNDQLVGYVANGTFSVQGRNLLSAEGITLPANVKVLSLDENPSIRTKIAQFYTFA